MSIEVSMPQLGESVAEGTLVKWHKKIGDRIDRDEILFEISTDKVDTEIPSPEEGYLEKILVPEGETVPVHTVVCCISKLPPAASESADGQKARSGGSWAVAASSAGAGSLGAVAGGAGSPVTGEGRPVGGSHVVATPRVAAERPEAPAPSPQPAWSEDRVVEMARERTSPLVRRLATEQGVDLARVQGTGLGGRVTKDDLLRHLESRGRSSLGFTEKSTPRVAATEAPPPQALRVESLPAPLETAPAPSPIEAQAVPPETVATSGEDRLEPMPVMRQKIAEHMLASRRTSAHVTTVFEVDLTPVRELRSFFGERFEERSGARLTFLPFIIQAVARSLRKFPILNASIEGKNVRLRGQVNIGIAVALENGLVVPVIRQADAKDLAGIARAVQDLARRARSKELQPDEVKDGTFTITNPGVFGSIIGTPIIHQPQVAILCVGAVVKRPVVLPGTDAIAVRSMAYFSLTFDHRLIDGAIGDRFLGDIKSTLENASFDGLAGLK